MWPTQIEDTMNKLEDALLFTTPWFVIEHGYIPNPLSGWPYYSIKIQQDQIYEIRIQQNDTQLSVQLKDNNDKTIATTFQALENNLNKFIFYVQDNTLYITGIMALQFVNYKNEEDTKCGIFCTQNRDTAIGNQFNNWGFVSERTINYDMFDYVNCNSTQRSGAQCINKVFPIIIDDYIQKDVLGIYNNIKKTHQCCEYILTDRKTAVKYKAVYLVCCFDVIQVEEGQKV